MTPLVYAIDPGTTQSAMVVYCPFGSTPIVNHLTLPNTELLQLVSDRLRRAADTLVIEQIESMGMAVGAEVFETVFWSGRFAQAWAGYHASMPWSRVTRRAVKLHLCGTSKAKDANIRQAILDRFGGSSAIGLKKTPGPLYGVKGHEFAALAVALTFVDTVLAKESHAVPALV